VPHSRTVPRALPYTTNHTAAHCRVHQAHTIYRAHYCHTLPLILPHCHTLPHCSITLLHCWTAAHCRSHYHTPPSALTHTAACTAFYRAHCHTLPRALSHTATRTATHCRTAAHNRTAKHALPHCHTPYQAHCSTATHALLRTVIYY